MKLQTKLTLMFACLLLLAASLLLLGLHLVSDAVAKNAADSILEDTVKRYVSGIGYENGQLKENRYHNFDDGVYFLVFNADGTEQLTGMDIFGISSLAPSLLQENPENQVFLINTEEADVYCYYLWRSEGTDIHGHYEKNGDLKDKPYIWEQYTGEYESGEPETRVKSTERSYGNESSDGVWVMGILPEDNMENIMDTVIKVAWTVLMIIVLFSAFGGWLISGRSLRHLRRITESAREITDGNDLSRRISLPPGRDEVHELADTFNDMMDRLEQSFEAERQFTSDASHELRTPTTVILAECEMAEKFPEDAQAAQESIAEIHRQAQKMSEIIGKLLGYTRLEQGTRRIEMETINLSELVEDVCEEQRSLITDNIEISFESEPEIMVNGDASLLISLVQNLISNAVKYGKENGHVYVRVYNENSLANVSVRDDGIGISEEDQKRIWNRFYQADRSRSDEKRGVGLGLSLVKQIARLHGGMVSVSSKEGEGSEFIFSMPLL